MLLDCSSCNSNYKQIKQLFCLFFSLQLYKCFVIKWSSSKIRQHRIFVYQKIVFLFTFFELSRMLQPARSLNVSEKRLGKKKFPIKNCVVLYAPCHSHKAMCRFYKPKYSLHATHRSVSMLIQCRAIKTVSKHNPLFVWKVLKYATYMTELPAKHF